MPGFLEFLRTLVILSDEDAMPDINEKISRQASYLNALDSSRRLTSQRPSDLGPNQLQWCRDNLANFAKYEGQALAAHGSDAERRQDAARGM
jgi:hypothetical protein